LPATGVVLLLAMSLVVPLLMVRGAWNVDQDGYSLAFLNMPEVDFTNMFAGGTLARTGLVHVLFNQLTYSEWMRSAILEKLPFHQWSYPPSMLLLAVPFSLLPLFLGYLVWTALSWAFLAICLRYCRLPLDVIIPALVSPAVVVNIALGQNGALTAGLLVGSLMLSERRPVIAGVLAGLLTLKPHLGIMLPVCFIASGNWKAIIAAIATAGALVVITAQLWGWDTWALFLSQTEPMMRGILEAPWPQGYMAHAVSVFLFARSVGATVLQAYVAQAACCAVAVVLVWLAWRHPGTSVSVRMAYTVTLTFLATPYAWSYDLVAFSVAAAVILSRGHWKIRSGEGLIWVWPGLASITTHWGHPLTPFIMILTTALIGWREAMPVWRRQPKEALLFVYKK
jgi:hypothetical protein